MTPGMLVVLSAGVFWILTNIVCDFSIKNGADCLTNNLNILVEVSILPMIILMFSVHYLFLWVTYVIEDLRSILMAFVDAGYDLPAFIVVFLEEILSLPGGDFGPKGLFGRLILL